MKRAEHIILITRTWIGTPYQHQASTKGAGTDCLGLLRGVWRELVGGEPETVPSYSADWSEASGREDLMLAAHRWLTPVSNPENEVGQVLLFRMRNGSVAKHLGILSKTEPYLAFIHAYSGHGVIETALSDPWRRKVAARFQFPEGK